MRIVFVGRENFANHCFANWIAQHHELCAYFKADVSRYTGNYRRKWLRNRVRRKGLLRTVDEMLFQMYYRVFQHNVNQLLLTQTFAENFGYDFFDRPPNVPYYEFPDLNCEEATKKLQELKPDLVFAVCVTQFLKKPYSEIPKYGTALYHEGLTPEYKGLHTPFWANYNGDEDRIGYTLLRVNDKLDGGEPIAQGVGTVHPDLARYWVYSGHKVLIDGLSEVKKALEALEQGESIQINREKGPARMYSYAGMTDELQRMRSYRKKRA
jgi:methionyl-tRNA formyltransferase